MKKNLSFTIYKEIEVDEIEKTKNEKGEDIQITKKVKKKEPHNYFISKPGRSLFEQSELYYSKVYWDCVNNGINPSILLQKHYLDNKGVLSEEQKKEYNKLNLELFEKQAKYQQLNSKIDKTENETTEMNEILAENIQILTKLQNFENKATDTLYQNTAENIAQNRTATWWMLHLSYEELADGKQKLFFGEGSYSDKLKTYDDIENKENSFDLDIIKKLYLATSLWYFKDVNKQEDFDLMLKMYEGSELIAANNTINEIKDSVSEPINSIK